MITFETCGELLDDIADSLPLDLYRNLNGGIILLPEIKIHPKAVNNDLFILGEYRHDNLGRYIVIFYGSFQRVYGNLPIEAFKQKLDETLRHELRHHNEFLAGYNDLVIYDNKKISQYLKNKQENGS